VCEGWIPHVLPTRHCEQTWRSPGNQKLQAFNTAIYTGNITGLKTSCTWIVSQVFVLRATTSILAVIMLEVSIVHEAKPSALCHTVAKPFGSHW
jgi:hypothetical protein